MANPEQVRAVKRVFSDAVETAASGHKVIAAARNLREVYQQLTETEQTELLAWVQLRSPLGAFITGEDKSYFIQVAVHRKGLRRADLEHLTRYSSEDPGAIGGTHDDNDEYTFNIWRTEWRYIQGFLKQFEIAYRIVEESEDHFSPLDTSKKS